MKHTISQLFSGAYNGHLIAGVAFMFVAYSFLIVGTIVMVNDRKDLRSDIQEEQLAVAEAEINFFKSSAMIDNEFALAQGYQPVGTPHFVYNVTSDDKVALGR